MWCHTVSLCNLNKKDSCVVALKVVKKSKVLILTTTLKRFTISINVTFSSVSCSHKYSLHHQSDFLVPYMFLMLLQRRPHEAMLRFHGNECKKIVSLSVARQRQNLSIVSVSMTDVNTAGLRRLADSNITFSQFFPIF